MKKILISPADERLKDLSDFIGRQDHKTLVLWTIDCAKRMIELFEAAFPLDDRPRRAVEAAKKWAFGIIKMPTAKQAAHAAHHAATEVFAIDKAACAASRACGHTLGTVHTQKHATAFLVYFLSALILTSQPGKIDLTIDKETAWLYDRLVFWQSNSHTASDIWAPFM
jgi:hypothetical protein